MKHLLLIVALAITLAFASKPTDDWTTLGCYQTEQEMEVHLNEVLTAISSGPYTVFGVETFRHGSAYCYKIHTD